MTFFARQKGSRVSIPKSGASPQTCPFAPAHAPRRSGRPRTTVRLSHRKRPSRARALSSGRSPDAKLRPGGEIELFTYPW